MHKLLIPFLALGSLFHPAYSQYAQMVDKVSMSVVHITGEMTQETIFGTQHGNYSCTGEVIAVGKVLTAAHCVQGEKMKSEDDELVVLAQDKVADLALVRTDTHQRPSLHLRKAPVVCFETLTALGFAYGRKPLSVLLERVFIVKGYLWGPDEDGTTPPSGVLVQGGYIGGMSGGPVVDAKGLQVSIVQRGGEFIGYGVDAQTIRTFLAGVK